MTARRRRWVLVLGGLALLVTGGVYARQAQKPAPTLPGAAPPEFPAAVTDADVRAALTRAREQVAAEPGSGQAWGELGLTFRAHNLNAESNVCFAAAARLDPRNPRWPYLYGVINLLVAPDDALPHLRAARDLAVEPEHQSLTRLRLAEALLDRGDLDGAGALFAEEARANPLNPRAGSGWAPSPSPAGTTGRPSNTSSSPAARRSRGGRRLRYSPPATGSSATLPTPSGASATRPTGRTTSSGPIRS